MTRTALVVTTINDGQFCEFLQPVMETAPSEISLIVIGDHKTSPSCGEAIARLSASGLDATWLGVAEQREWLTRIPEFGRHVPWNSDNRRNIGVLEAWRRGFDAIVSIDDDNVPLSADGFLRRGLALDHKLERQIVTAGDNRWVNVCELLECRSRHDGGALHVFPRGHPYSRRDAPGLKIQDLPKPLSAVLHLGLWLDEPDVDAATRGSVAPLALRARIDTPVLMPLGARAALSSQNQAVARRLVPAWWFARMGRIAGDVVIDRYGDMLQGYFACMAIEAMGERIAVGPPLVQHRRNAHSLVNDLSLELPGATLLEAMLPLIEAPLPAANSYDHAYRQIADSLTDWARTAHAALWGDNLPRWADETADTMNAWCDACRALDAG